MRITYLSRSLLPSKTANSVHVMKMCQALAQNGHKVNLVASGRIKANNRAVYDFYGVKDNFELTLLRGKSDNVFGLIVYLLNFYFYLKKLKNPPDLFYGRDIFTLALATCLFKDIPYCLEVHKPPTSIVHALITARLMSKKKLIALVVITNALKEEYCRRYPAVPEQKIVVAPDGADIPEREQRRKQKSGSSRLVIGYVGSLYPGRGMEIVCQLAQRLTQYDFHVIGGAEKDVERWRKTCISLENIYFKGFVPHGELKRQYDEIDIVLAPYQKKVTVAGGGGDTARWMSPLKIFEYMAYGKPIIASDLPALKEVLTHGDNALLCPPNRLDDWVKAVQLLAEDQNLRDRLAAAAFSCLQEKYTWEKRAARIVDLL